MFIVSKIEDQIRVLPQDLTKTPVDAVTAVIEQRFLDKVIPNLGLVVTIYDVLSIEGGFVYPNDGAAFFKVQFRVVVFRPFVGEVIVGKLKSCSREGLRVSLEFFEDVLIPEHALQDPSFYDEAERLWVWKFEGNDMYLDLSEPIRFRVQAVRFASPPTPMQLQNATGDDKLLGTAAKPFSPMTVLGDINGDGLGLTSWWAG
ncbi:DNA-directed RNA polymerase III subunit RPC8 [Tetrabaena socialis]|uniref:RNA polymerase III subunit C25 n=1 Tax=Tetrabaena socialis TaxID=47790 RepID=A0A2J8AAS0_9CHLO|nr:DNA-directed RNA polymerase III subunit RPC8 [Tetrabaena socialis]|eukprot:PNH09607.1 DNA-directed RNA polymerase III subunit RPC8 [Tetrabaena socialis]